MKQTYDLIIKNVNIATMAGKDNFGVITDAAIYIKDSLICNITSNEHSQKNNIKALSFIDGKGRWVTPGLIDCHTHLVYGGNRVDEFEKRLEGAGYEEIARSGGGILSTVDATRKATKEELLKSTSKRLRYFLDEGVTYIEIKSGYGLDLANERKMLEVAQAISDNNPIEVSKTFLGAHTVPKEYKNNSDTYIELLCEQIMPKLKALNLIDCVDAFCENVGFNVRQITKVFNKARDLGLPVKLHAEQLSNINGSEIACEYGAWSVDHLEFLKPESVNNLKKSNTVATLLPGAYYFLNETQMPPISAFREHNIPIAIATDSNPGSSPCYSILLMLNMATTLFKFTPYEALKGVTINAAKALRVDDKVGSIEIGKQADLVVWDIDSPAELSYRISGNPCLHVVKKGKIVLSKLPY